MAAHLQQCPVLTTAFGSPVEDNDNTRTVGKNGAVAADDTWLQEKMQRFNRERVPERVVHAKGYGAKGVFKVTQDVTKYTHAHFLNEIGKETPVLIRFSTVGGESGSADTARDPRGFAAKFYTEEGNWDMVGNNTPVFFIRDPLKFSDFIHTQKREPGSHLKPHWRRWDYWSLSPEALHQVMILYSDRGCPVSGRFMNGYSSHTMSMVNHDGERVWVKWHFKTDQGIRNLPEDEANRIAGGNPDFSAHDLQRAIQEGDFPSWTVSIQVMPEKDADSYKWHPFDLTKVWPHSDYPLIEVGKLTLNENPSNYFAEIEQAAFEPSNLVPGLGISPDKVLQNRLNSYKDAHYYRIGVNYHQIPVNRPRGCPYSMGTAGTYARDGTMRTDGNGENAPDYEPNSFGGPVAMNKRCGSEEAKLSADDIPELAAKEYMMDAKGPARRVNWYKCDDEDYFGQPRMLWSDVFDDGQRDRLVNAIAGSLSDSPERIKLAILPQFFKVHEDFGNGVAEKLGIDKSKIPSFEEVMKNNGVHGATSIPPIPELDSYKTIEKKKESECTCSPCNCSGECKCASN
eukprot:CAMPEP_0202037908 /NCGR_PEP_ID=MMETSP0962-20130828/2448_1 /ASSEMBLY_ACC=CAM_ASM_000488 /TAXON_ID=4773 /ORGANISM="Schizochytrium aggregatum, Strain ATCC28209" /LENGTH=568 /DNA_ID=CAMNT_0048602037 /DNA_START=50 /DNA_END=1756 /DNA_ORIENTATION=+